MGGSEPPLYTVHYFFQFICTHPYSTKIENFLYTPVLDEKGELFVHILTRRKLKIFCTPLHDEKGELFVHTHPRRKLKIFWAPFLDEKRELFVHTLTRRKNMKIFCTHSYSTKMMNYLYTPMVDFLYTLDPPICSPKYSNFSLV